MPYNFGYNIKDTYGSEQYRKEESDGERVTGSYGYLGLDGIYRHVDYVADDNGFRANIRTNEPGTANQNPASVSIIAEQSPSSGLTQNLAYDSPQIPQSNLLDDQDDQQEQDAQDEQQDQYEQNEQHDNRLRDGVKGDGQYSDYNENAFGQKGGITPGYFDGHRHSTKRDEKSDFLFLDKNKDGQAFANNGFEDSIEDTELPPFSKRRDKKLKQKFKEGERKTSEHQARIDESKGIKRVKDKVKFQSFYPILQALKNQIPSIPKVNPSYPSTVYPPTQTPSYFPSFTQPQSSHSYHEPLQHFKHQTSSQTLPYITRGQSVTHVPNLSTKQIENEFKEAVPQKTVRTSKTHFTEPVRQVAFQTSTFVPNQEKERKGQFGIVSTIQPFPRLSNATSNIDFSHQYSTSLAIKSDFENERDGWEKDLVYELPPTSKVTTHSTNYNQKPNFKFDEESSTFDRKANSKDYATLDTVLNFQSHPEQYQSINPFLFKYRQSKLASKIEDKEDESKLTTAKVNQRDVPTQYQYFERKDVPINDGMFSNLLPLPQQYHFLVHS